tara:strand:+ start:78 stop:416 length:339 start_codon:yes stop_codon:yes gene_type:complete
MTYLKTLPNLTVKEQSGIITDLIVKFFESNGWTEIDDEGRGILFENPKLDLAETNGFANDQYIQFYKGYFGANSEPSVLGTWMSDSDAHPDAIEMEKQADAYLTEIKKSILS